MLRYLSPSRLAIASGLSLLTAASAGAGVVYHNSFDTSVADFTESRDVDWSLDTVDGHYAFFRNDSVFADPLGAVTRLTELGGSYTRDFVVRTRVNQVQQYGGVGLILLADAPTLSSTTRMYTATFGRGGGGNMGVYLGERGDSPNASTPSTNTSSGVTGWTELTVTGTYQPGGSLRLDFHFERSDLLTFDKTIVDPTPATGQYFGLYGQRQAWQSNRPVEAVFDYFTVESPAVPEPNTLAGLACAAALTMRRRKPTA